jgi:hypothetical protein
MDEAIDRARNMNEFFGPLVPGQLGCVFDTAMPDLVVGHIDVTANLIAGTGFLFADLGGDIPEDATFRTIELTSDLLSVAQTAAWSTVRRTRFDVCDERQMVLHAR